MPHHSLLPDMTAGQPEHKANGITTEAMFQQILLALQKSVSNILYLDELSEFT